MVLKRARNGLRYSTRCGRRAFGFRCETILLHGTRPRRLSGNGDERVFCDRCTGFFASRYGFARVEEMTLQEYLWQLYWDQEIWDRVYGVE